MDRSEDWYAYEILVVCDMLHSHSCGSGEPLSRDDEERFASWLKARLAGWSPTASPYDAAVRALCEIALLEWRDCWSQRVEAAVHGP